MMTTDDYKSLTDPTFVRPINFYVIAGNYNEYLEHAKNHAVKYPDENRRILFVQDQVTFRGTENPEGILIGTWRKRLDIKPVLHALYVCTKDIQRARKIRILLQSVL
jgi:hypothetical protein